MTESNSEKKSLEHELQPEVMENVPKGEGGDIAKEGGELEVNDTTSQDLLFYKDKAVKEKPKLKEKSTPKEKPKKSDSSENQKLKSKPKPKEKPEAKDESGRKEKSKPKDKSDQGAEKGQEEGKQTSSTGKKPRKRESSKVAIEGDLPPRPKKRSVINSSSTNVAGEPLGLY